MKIKMLSYNELMILNRNLYFYLKSGYTLEKALKLIKKQKYIGIRLKLTLNKVWNELQRGKGIYNSFTMCKNVPFYMLYMIKIGEETGRIQNIFKQLWLYYQWKSKEKKELVNIIVYPIFLLFSSIAIFFIVVLYFIPYISELFVNLGTEIPSSLKKLLNINNILNNYGIYILIIFTIFIFSIWFILRKNKMLYYVILNKLPFIKHMYIKIFNVNFFYSQYMLLSNGLTLFNSLNITCNLEKDPFIKEKLKNSIEDMTNGLMLYEVLYKSNLFMGEEINLILTGEETGELDESFKNAFILKQEEIKNNLKGFFRILQPITIILLGFIIFNIIYNSVLPIMDMMEYIQ